MSEGKPAEPQEEGAQPAEQQEEAAQPAEPQEGGAQPAEPQEKGAQPAEPQEEGAQPAVASPKQKKKRKDKKSRRKTAKVSGVTDVRGLSDLVSDPSPCAVEEAGPVDGSAPPNQSSSVNIAVSPALSSPDYGSPTTLPTQKDDRSACDRVPIVAGRWEGVTKGRQVVRFMGIHSGSSSTDTGGPSLVFAFSSTSPTHELLPADNTRPAQQQSALTLQEPLQQFQDSAAPARLPAGAPNSRPPSSYPMSTRSSSSPVKFQRRPKTESASSEQPLTLFATYGVGEETPCRPRRIRGIYSVADPFGVDVIELEAQGVLSPSATFLSPSTTYNATTVKFKDVLFASENSIHGVICTIFYSVISVLANVMTKNLEVPAEKIFFYTTLVIMTSSMPSFMHEERPPFAPLHLQPLFLLRALFFMASIMCRAMALRDIHVTIVAAIGALKPIGVTLGSWLALHEKVCALQWVSMAMTMTGVLIVINPVGFSQTSLLNLSHVAGLLFALGSVMAGVQGTLMSKFMATHSIGAYGFNVGSWYLTTAVLVNIMTGNMRKLFTGRFLGSLVMMCEVTCASYYFLGKAWELETVVVVTAINYSAEMVFSLVFDIIFFDTHPDFWECVGTIVIIMASLLTGYDKLVHLYGIDTSLLRIIRDELTRPGKWILGKLRHHEKTAM